MEKDAEKAIRIACRGYYAYDQKLAKDIEEALSKARSEGYEEAKKQYFVDTKSWHDAGWDGARNWMIDYLNDQWVDRTWPRSILKELISNLRKG